MENVQQLREAIEQKRRELEKALSEESFEAYYQKSLDLDQLIEQYIDLENLPPLSTTATQK